MMVRFAGNSGRCRQLHRQRLRQCGRLRDWCGERVGIETVCGCRSGESRGGCGRRSPVRSRNYPRGETVCGGPGSPDTNGGEQCYEQGICRRSGCECGRRQLCGEGGGHDDRTADAGRRSGGAEPGGESALRGHGTDRQGKPGEWIGTDESTRIGNSGRDALPEGELVLGSLRN